MGVFSFCVRLIQYLLYRKAELAGHERFREIGLDAQRGGFLDRQQRTQPAQHCVGDGQA
jgi:hypothetical protein